ncbi:hypothetical protein HK097_009639 [Rhizophlyctis rosea]|uniref:AB hydrolase-1 domain-containing protein n=1 Tax=Rhizophlyctis rosea TaxID=64517 RepID=A0AAD5S8M9_9FUNG|nr:hypothetical protein HK097_009639 [Rhizophlyctis rosea]
MTTPIPSGSSKTTYIPRQKSTDLTFPPIGIHDRLLRNFIHLTVAVGLYQPLIWSAGVFSLLYSVGSSVFRSKPRRSITEKGQDEHVIPLNIEMYGRHEYVKLNGQKIHYVQRGPVFTSGAEKPPLMLFIHGYPACWFTWRHQLLHFSSKYNCVALDLVSVVDLAILAARRGKTPRGYGFSSKPDGLSSYTAEEITSDIKALIISLGYESATVVGHDWGGLVAWSFAARFQTMIDSLILINITHQHQLAFRNITVRQFLMSHYMYFYQLPRIPELFMSPTKTAGTPWRSYFVSEGFTRPEADFYRRNIILPGLPTSALNYYRNIFNGGWGPIERQPNTISKPTLIVWGDGDKALDKQTCLQGVEAFFETAPEVAVVPGGGHWAVELHYEVVSRHIEEFLVEGELSSSVVVV